MEGGARARARGWGGTVEEQGEEGGARARGWDGAVEEQGEEGGARARGWDGAVEEQGEEGRGLRATLLREDSEGREGVNVCG